MNYLTKTEHESKAERIAKRASELANHVESTLRSMHSELANADDPQAVLDVFGSSAVQVLSDYGAMYEAVKAINPSSTVPAPDLTIFVPSNDGTVAYVAPEAEEDSEP
jgi:hypothetical protein